MTKINWENIDKAVFVLAELMGEKNDKIAEFAKNNDSFDWRGNRVSIYARADWVELFDSKGKTLAGVAVPESDARLGKEKAPAGYKFTTNKFVAIRDMESGLGL